VTGPLPSRRGKLLRPKIIVRRGVQQHRSVIFVFGDNMERRGMGGQAGAMRGEWHTVGVPTKWSPAMTPDAFFADKDLDNPNVRRALLEAFDKIGAYILAGSDVTIPADGLGTGLARLPVVAPRIHRFIENRVAALGTPVRPE
jgi:hypothetical protein